LRFQGGWQQAWKAKPPSLGASTGDSFPLKKSFHDKIFTIFNIMVIETIKWYLAFPHGDSFHFFSGHLRYLRNLRNGD
jgi:hypothetical protein